MMFNFKLRFTCKYSNFKFYKRTCATANANCKLVSNLLQLPEKIVLQYLTKYKVTKKDPELLEECIKYCQQLGYKSEDILKTKGLLTVHPLVVKQHYLSLEEGGFYNIQSNVLGSSVKYMRQTIESLKNKKLIERSTNVAISFLNYIKNREFVEYFQEQSPELFQCVEDESTWIDVHFRILKEFLKFSLNATEDDMIKLFRIHRMIKYKSFRTIEENIKIALSLEFYPERILRYGYLLNNYPDYPKTTLKEFPTLGNQDTRKLMKAYPKLIMTSPSNIRKILKLLEEFNISENAITTKPSVFYLSPETLRYRLEAVQNSPELKGLIHHPRVLAFIVHHHRTKSRLTFLQQLKLKCANFNVLSTDYVNRFVNYLRAGKDVNSISTVEAVLKTLMPNVDQSQALNRLKKHPYYLYVPVKDMYESYMFLTSCGFTPENISEVIWLILYPSQKIDKSLEQVKNDFGNKFDTMDPVTQLNLILYDIETPYHFNGNGIWIDDGLSDDDLLHKTLE